MSGELITPNNGIADWGTFKKATITSVDLNSYVLSVMAIAPLVASALPLTLTKIENDSYSEFESIWNIMTSLVPISDSLLQQLIALATSCNLPVKFIDILNS